MWSSFANLATKGIESGIITEKKDLLKDFQQGLSTLKTEGRWSEFFDLAIKGIELGIIKIEKPSQLIEILKEKSQIDWQGYDYQLVAQLLRNQEDLGKFFLEYKPALFSLIKYSQEINQELPQEKKTDNPEEFMKKYQLEIAKLHFFDLELSNSFLSQTLKNHGFPRLERYFENVVKGFNPEVLKEYLSKIKNLDSEYFSRLIEISSAYQRMNLEGDLEKVLKESTQKEINSLDLIRILGKNLLEKFAQKLEIKARIQENAFNKWNLEYLPRLFTAEAQYQSEDKELLKLIMKASFQEKSFLPVLFGQFQGEYNQDEKEWLEEIKKYNLKVKEEFEKNGLDFNQWLNYQEKKGFTVGVSPEQLKERKIAFEKEVVENIIALLGSFREKKPGLLAEEEAKEVFNKIIKKYGLQFKQGEIYHFQKGKFSIKDIGLILKDFNQLIEQYYQKEQNKEKKNAIGTVLDHLKTLEKRIPDLEKELTRKGYSLKIQIWQREPGYDIFQGNYTHCCVAVENFNRGAILDYLIDSGLQVVEIRDEAEDKTIAQTWLWLAKDSQNNLNLVLDNVEINGDYTGLQEEIKKNLFSYLKDYALSFGQGKIRRLLLGTAYNDIETKELDKISLSLSKIAGSPRETEYLDALGSNWLDPKRETVKNLFEVKEIKEKPIEKKKPFEIEIKIEEVNRVNQELIDQINRLEEECFPEALRTPAEEYLRMRGLHLLLKKENEIVGNISAIETKEVPSLVDPNHLNKETLYVWTIAIKPEERSLKTFYNLIKEFTKKVQERKIKKLVMHTRVNEHLSDVLQSRYGAKKIRREENWLDSGEPFDYLEIDLEKILGKIGKK